jgi:WD40 repeat protein
MELWCVQSKSYRKGSKLVACMYNENRVVIHDLDTCEQMAIDVNGPWKCALSQRYIAVANSAQGVQLFSRTGKHTHVVPESRNVSCIAFHPSNEVVAIGFKDGSICVWDAQAQGALSLFTAQSDCVINIRFAPNGCLFLSSYNETASLITLDDAFKLVSSMKFEGHTGPVIDILPLPSSNQCITCGSDKTIKVWDCQTGAWLCTLTEHTEWVVALRLHPSVHVFASASFDRSVIIWSFTTYELQRRIVFQAEIRSLVFGANDMMYVGVHGCGVTPCNAHTGEVGSVIIPAVGYIQDVALCMFDTVLCGVHVAIFFFFDCSTFVQALDCLLACPVVLVSTV